MKSKLGHDERRWRMLKFKVLEQKVEAAFELLESNRLEPILLKGWAASLKYPEQYERLFSDIDLAVAPELYEEAANVIERHKFLIDLHKGLRYLDTLEWKQLFNNSVTHKLGRTDIRILCEEDHLRVLCVHWLVDGGEYKDKLWDIFYAVENRPKDFDWKKCLDVVSRKRRLWVIYTIGLAHRYLNLDISNLPFQDEARKIPKWMIKTVEKEWANPLRLRPIHTCLNDRREVFRQIIKRIPPNPIQATVESEGDFDEKGRFLYQLESIYRRLIPSAKRIANSILSHRK